MLSKCRSWIGCIVLLLLLVFILLFFEWASDRDDPQISASYLLRDDGGRSVITLPFSGRHSVDRTAYKYIVELIWQKGGNTCFRVVPDDYLESITVNGRLMPEALYSGPGRGDWQNGLIVDFNSYLREGKNELLFRILNTGGPYGMDLKRTTGEGSSGQIFTFALLSMSILFLFWFLLFYGISRR